MDVLTQFSSELRSLWPQHHMPFSQYDWHKSWYDVFGANESLVVCADRTGLIPLAIKNGVAHFTGGEEIADYLDALGSPDWTDAMTILRNHGATQLLLRNIPDGSLTLSFFQRLRQATISKEDTTPILTLPITFDAYQAALGRKERHELRRKMRRFEEQYKDTSVQRTIDIPLLLALMRGSSEKKVFLTSDMEAFFQTLPAVVPELNQFTLVAGQKPVATTVAFRVDQSLLLYNSGYELEGSGWYLKAKIIEWAISETLTTLNFLQGGERYKYDFGATDFPVYRVELPL